MARNRFAWALALPLTAAGWLTAHSAAYRVAGPHEAHAELHRYLVTVRPAAFAAAAAAMIACFAFGVRRSPRGRPPLAFFAIVPFVGFALQEQVERYVHHDAFTFSALAEPTFVLGLVFQLPFALAAFALARALFALGSALGRVRSSWASPRLPLAAFHAWATEAPELPRPPALALGYGERGPPRAPLVS